MLTPLLFALALVFATAPTADPAPAAPVAATPAPTTPAATTPVVPPKPDPVRAEIDTILGAYKGKSGDPLRGKLGFSIGKRAASDGEVVFWMVNVEQDTVCGMDPVSGAMRCLRPEPFQCRLAIAFDPKGIVKAWAVTGEPNICRGFITLLKAP